MKHQRKVEWKRLDNAAKIFPPTSSDRDTKVFRFALELNEKVDPIILQKALDVTMESFPFYRAVLRAGVFWYYLEKTNKKPLVEEENNTICAPIFFDDKRELLFRIFYYGNRINLEIHHSLTDGTGAVWLLQTLTYHYITMKHQVDFMVSMPERPYSPSLSDKTDDSFQKYYTGDKNIKREKQIKAYRIKGTRMEDNRNILIEGSMSVKALINEAHKYDTTLTGFLASLLIHSIYKEMTLRQQNTPIVISVPINLRQFFESESARNFFGTIRVKYNISEEGTSFENIVKVVNQTFNNKLTGEELSKQLNRFMYLENNKIIKIVPLPIKNIILRLADYYNERGITAGLSNIGIVKFPKEFHSFIRQVNVCVGARRPQLSVVSFNDNLTLSFTSPYMETAIQYHFIEFLASKGISIDIASNIEV